LRLAGAETKFVRIEFGAMESAGQDDRRGSTPAPPAPTLPSLTPVEPPPAPPGAAADAGS
jgi:hypothetical protein